MIFPYVIGTLLVFTGILMGYFFANRERGESENNRLGLAKENIELKESLQRGQQSVIELEAKYSRQNGQLNVLQQLCDDWSASREEAERDRTKLQVLFEEQQSRSDELATQLADQTQRRNELEDQLHQLQHEQVERLGIVETNWLKKHSEVESLLAQRESDLKHLNDDKARLADQLHASEARNAELSSELSSQREMYETATNNASGMKQEYTTLETSLKHSGMRLKDAEAKCAKAISAKNLAEESLQAIREQLEIQRNENIELNSQLAGLSSLQQQFGAVQASLTSSDERLQIVASERDRALGAEKAAYENMIGLHKQIENQESTIKTLRGGHDDALDKLRCEIENRAELEKNFERERMVVQQELKTRTDQLDSVECERDQLIAQLTDQRDDLARQLEEEANQRLHFEQTWRQSNDDLTELKFECERLHRCISDESNQKEQFSASLEQSNEQLNQLQSKCTELESEIAAEAEQRTQYETNWKQSCDQIIELRAELEQLLTRIKGEDQEREAILAEYTAMQHRVEDESAARTTLETQKQLLESSLKTLKVRCDQMMVELSELQSIRDQHSIASDRWQEVRLRLEHTVKQRDRSMDQLAAKNNEIEQLENQLGSANETVRQLRDRLQNLAAQKSSDNVILSLSQARTTVDHEYGGHTRVDEIRGVVFTERPNIVDDLKMISGVAEVLEQKLNDYGVYTFRQVMEWNEINIEEFKQLLPSFKDRIVREDWIGQAAHLYHHFHGDSADRRVA